MTAGSVSCITSSDRSGTPLHASEQSCLGVLFLLVVALPFAVMVPSRSNTGAAQVDDERTRDCWTTQSVEPSSRKLVATAGALRPECMEVREPRVESVFQRPSKSFVGWPVAEPVIEAVGVDAGLVRR